MRQGKGDLGGVVRARYDKRLMVFGKAVLERYFRRWRRMIMGSYSQNLEVKEVREVTEPKDDQDLKRRSIPD